MVLGKAEVKDDRNHSFHVPQDGPGEAGTTDHSSPGPKDPLNPTCYGAQEQGLHYTEGIMSAVSFLKGNDLSPTPCLCHENKTNKGIGIIFNMAGALWWASHGSLLQQDTGPSPNPPFLSLCPRPFSLARWDSASPQPGPNHKTLPLTSRQLCFQCKQHHLHRKYSLPRSKAVFPSRGSPEQVRDVWLLPSA